MHTKILSLFFIGFSLVSFSQNYTNSPFSSYGLGEYGGLDHGIFSGMGNASIAIIDTTVLNFNNPSSYASLGKGQPLFSTGISSRFSEFKTGSELSNSKIIGLDHFALAVPFLKNFGLAVGLKPFSRTGYDFYQLEQTATEKMKYIYRGSGGTHEVFGGLSANVLEFTKHRLGVGINFGYVFGSNVNERISYIDKAYNATDAIPGGVENTGYRLKALNYKLGVNYQWNLDKFKTLTVAGIFSPQQQLNAFQNSFLAYSTDVNNSNKFVYQDTISEVSGTITMPSSWGVGFSYTMRPKSTENRTKIYQLMVTGEVQMTDWSSYRTEFNGAAVNGNYGNTMRVSVGAQYSPHFNYLDRSTSIGYLSRIRYRAGFQYATHPLVLQTKQQTDMMVSIGFGLPIAIQRSSSSINFGFTAGQRGNGDAQSVNERFIGFNFGVTVSPGINDRWFRKFKID